MRLLETAALFFRSQCRIHGCDVVSGIGDDDHAVVRRDPVIVYDQFPYAVGVFYIVGFGDLLVARRGRFQKRTVVGRSSSPPESVIHDQMGMPRTETIDDSAFLCRIGQDRCRFHDVLGLCRPDFFDHFIDDHKIFFPSIHIVTSIVRPIENDRIRLILVVHEIVISLLTFLRIADPGDHG